jgi:hypothetical protein
MESEKSEHLATVLRTLKERFKSERDRHKFTGLWIKLSTAILAAVATVLLGWQDVSASKWPQNIALVLNAAISVIAAYEVFFEPRKLWVRETLVFSTLKDIERDLEFEVAGPVAISDQKVDELKNRIDRVLKQSLDEWHKDKRSET